MSESQVAAPTPDPWPREIRLSQDRRQLSILFEDGDVAELAAEYLRVESPSAEVRGHSPADRKTVAGKRHVEILGIDPVGNYAIKLVFSDGHATGIYGWGFLAELARRHDDIWGRYLDDLAAKHLSRDA